MAMNFATNVVVNTGNTLTVDGNQVVTANFSGATSSANGSKGYVPAPSAGDNDTFLKGDGTWSETQGDAFVKANDLDCTLSDKVNVLRTPYDEEDMIYNAIIFNNGTIVEGSSYASFVSPLISVSTGTYGLKVIHNGTTSNLHTGNSYNNGYGFFASDGTTVVSRPSAMQSLGNDIYVFEVPATASYVRFCATTNSATMATCLPYFNQWILLPNADDTITDSFFVLAQKKADGNISQLYRADGSKLTIVDTSKADKSDTVLTTTLSRGRKANTTVGTGSFAFGNSVESSGSYSFGEGAYTSATSSYSHAEGNLTTASGAASHAEGFETIAYGDYSHAEGLGTRTERRSQHSFGEFNVLDVVGSTKSSRGKYVEIVGNGTEDTIRSNARALDWDGNEYLMGKLYINCNANGTGGTLVDGISSLAFSTAVSIPVVGTPVTYTVPGITADYQLVRWNFSTSAENNPPASISWTTGSGTVTFTNNGGVTDETIQPVFAETTAVTPTVVVTP